MQKNPMSPEERAEFWRKFEEKYKTSVWHHPVEDDDQVYEDRDKGIEREVQALCGIAVPLRCVCDGFDLPKGDGHPPHDQFCPLCWSE